MEKEMSPMTTEMLKKGYLLFPKALFEEQMNMKTGEKAADAFEAFVFVLTHVNYSTVTCNVRGHLFDCVRGESVLSLARWMEILGWPRNRTRYFFNKMFDAGIVERVANPYVMHIRIPDYDFLTGNARPKAAPRKKKAAPVAGVGEDFCIFWEKFHDITEHPKVNIGRARREWKKLTAGEKQRVSIAMELLASPRLLILDEPTSGLSPDLDRSMMELCRKLSHENCTVLMVTHNMSNINLCDKIAFLGTGGVLCYYGSPEAMDEYFDVELTSDIFEKLHDPEQVEYYRRKYFTSPEFNRLAARFPAAAKEAEKRCKA